MSLEVAEALDPDPEPTVVALEAPSKIGLRSVMSIEGDRVTYWGYRPIYVPGDETAAFALDQALWEQCGAMLTACRVNRGGKCEWCALYAVYGRETCGEAWSPNLNIAILRAAYAALVCLGKIKEGESGANVRQGTD